MVKTTIKFLLVAFLTWLAVVMGLSIAAEWVGIPDTDTWMAITRVVSGILSSVIAGVVVSKHSAMKIFLTVAPFLTVITNTLYFVCFLLGATVVVMLFVKDVQWVGEHLYQPIVTPAVSLTLVSLIPLTIVLMLFRKTRALGGLLMYVLSIFMGFALWLFCLLVAADHGMGFLIVGLLFAGIGVVPLVVIGSLFRGEWAMAAMHFLGGTGRLWGEDSWNVRRNEARREGRRGRKIGARATRD